MVLLPIWRWGGTGAAHPAISDGSTIRKKSRNAGLDPASTFFFNKVCRRKKKVDPGSSPG
jgi:hypothetical protein